MKSKTKYLTEDTRVSSSQSFVETVPDYKLDVSTNELVRLPNDRNVQAKIDSYIECALDRAMRKFIPEVSATVDDVADSFDNAVLDLSVLGESIELAEHYREQLNLSDTASVSDIYSAVDKYAQDLNSRLSELRALSTKTNKGGSDNETPQTIK